MKQINILCYHYRNYESWLKLLCGNALTELKKLPDESVNMCVTSPPYWKQRDYGVIGQIGQEDTIEEYIQNLVCIFAEVKRILKKDGTLWLVIGDCYNGSHKGSGFFKTDWQQSKQNTNVGSIYLHGKKHISIKVEGLKSKDLIIIPARVAIALQKNGWWIRNDIIWYKPNTMTESVKDRCTNSHEYVWLCTKSKYYYYDIDAIREPYLYDGRKATQYGGSKKYQKAGIQNLSRAGRERWTNKKGKNKRDVWFVNTKAFPDAHYAVFPEKLIEPCILAGCPEGGTVLDPFIGSGTTAVICKKLNRKCVGIDLSYDNIKMTRRRLNEKI